MSLLGAIALIRLACDYIYRGVGVERPSPQWTAPVVIYCVT